MKLYEQIKNILDNLEKERKNILAEVEEKVKSGIYSIEYKDEVRLIANKEYAALLKNAENKINALVLDYKEKYFAVTTPTAEEIQNLNTIMDLLDKVNTSDQQLMGMVKPFKGNMLLMELLYKKLADKVKDYKETFKEYKDYVKKGNALKSMESFRMDMLNSGVHQNINTIHLGIYLKKIENLDNVAVIE